MASFAYPQVSGLLEKMSSSDKDFRFMATNDLMTELQKGSIQLDDETERKVNFNTNNYYFCFVVLPLFRPPNHYDFFLKNFSAKHTEIASWHCEESPRRPPQQKIFVLSPHRPSTRPPKFFKK